MLWVLAAVAQAIVIAAGVRQEQRAGLWSWSKVVFALGFAGLEFAVLAVPLFGVSLQSRYFGPVLGVAIVVAVANFVWFIVVCRRWRMPDGRTSLEAYRAARGEDQR